MKTNSSKTKKTNGTENSEGENLLKNLFIKELQDMYWAEKALVKAIPKMIKKVTSDELISALENHLSETEEQVNRIEQVFEIVGEPAKAKKCDGMNGLIKEADVIIRNTEEGAMRDAGIISAAQKVEHYEIASYGTLRTFANTLGLNEAADLLQESLDEEKSADEKLTELAESEVNVESAE